MNIDWARYDWGARYPAEPILDLPIPGGSAWPTGHVVVVDGTTSDEAGRIPLQRLPGRYALPSQLARATEPAFSAFKARYGQRALFDGRIVKLVAREDRLAWQEAGYFDYVRSNLLLDETGLRDAVHAAGRLEPLGDSVLANGIGLNLQLLTADGRLVAQRRAAGMAVWPAVWGPGAAGMAEPVDLDGVARLCDLRPWREINEELGVPEAALAGAPMRFLGLTRELARGGSPELHWAIRLPLDGAALFAGLGRARDGHELEGIRLLDPDDPGRSLDVLQAGASGCLLAGWALLLKAGGSRAV
ncbi:NUDIX hydrolase [Arenibaculum pallidiluteum]|uniref:hypothetical protein n=1 Tax=Arenibaculum pallidiluteum TaxID=2812559 RepID=UPI001A97A32A|nr:hypothetical protein [Arenibaculum pallidiluteum]